MSQEMIDIQIRIEKKVDVSISIPDIIEQMNEMPIKKRWNYIAQIINGIKTDLSELTEGEKYIIKKYLIEKLELF